MERIRHLSWILMLAGVLASTPAFAVYKICIDPGHGGADPGAVGCGLEEAPTCLDVAWRLHDLLAADPDLTPIMTRTSDVSVSLAGRVAYANDSGAHRFTSIHNNAFNGSATGIETFCYANGSAASFDQRDRIQDGMTSIWPALTDRGGKTANFYVIKYTDMPATLSELAFIDNCAIDATYLADPNQRQAAAAAHHQAIRLSLGLSGAIPDPGPDPGGTGVLRGVVFEDLGVGSEDMSVRLPGAAVGAVGGSGAGDDTAEVPDADWLIPLPPGTYTVTATAAGYFENARVCTVTTGQTTWCSIGLFEKSEDPPPPAAGVLRGVVYEDQGQGDQDMSMFLGGALVTVQGEDGSVDMVTTSVEGAAWEFTVPAGTWTVKASHPGYWLNTRICEVTSGAETWCSVGLFPVDQDPPLDPPIPEDGPHGILLGAVFEEQGSGISDMSIRLPGAMVKAAGALGTVTVVTDGAWGLYDMSLPPGTYEVTAALDGYWPNVRLCTVDVDSETWCSLGLWPEDQEVPEDSTPGYGGGVQEEPDPVAGDPTPDTDTTSGGSEPWTPAPGGVQPGDEPADGPGTGCGATAAGPGAGGCLPVLLAALFLLVLRRRPLAGVVALVLLCAAPAARAAEGEALRIVAPVALTDAGDFQQPVWSPDGAWLAFAGAHFDALLTVAAKGGDPRILAEGASVGYAPVWSPAGDAVEVRRPGQRSCAVPPSSVTVDGRPGPVPKHRTPGRWVRVRDDRVFLRQGRIERRLSPEGVRACCAILAPGGEAVAFMGLAAGIFVHDVATGRTVALGPGTHPAFSADGTRLVFDRCVDDGDIVTGCSLWMADLTDATFPLREIRGAHPMARHPALSPDSTHIAYDADGRIWVGRLE